VGSLLPLVALPLFYLIGLGVYRPYKYGTGGQRHLGLVPLGLVLFGYIIVPLFMGVVRGASQAGRAVATAPSSIEVVAVIVPVVLAMLAGAVNVWKFRPVTKQRGQRGPRRRIKVAGLPGRKPDRSRLMRS
jgi:hypothetical protein